MVASTFFLRTMPAIEQREARNRHHQHDAGGDDHPGGVGGVDLVAVRCGEARAKRSAMQRRCVHAAMARCSVMIVPLGRSARRAFRSVVPALTGSLWFVRRRSERVVVGFAGADAHRVIERGDENLAVADLSGLGGVGDRVDDLVDADRIGTAISIRILGRKFTAYSAPR